MRLKPGQIVLVILVCVVSLGAGYLARTAFQAPEPQPTLALNPDKLPATLAEFNLEDSHGQMRSSREWAGKVMVINFWATWCEPCREEMPLLMSMRETLLPQGVEIIGIAVDDTEAARSFGDSLGIEYPSLMAGKDGGFELLEMHNPHGVLPFTLVVDGDGNITERKLGVWTREELLAAVDKASG